MAESTINLDELIVNYGVLYDKISKGMFDRKTKILARSGIGKISGFGQNIEEIINFGNANYKTVNKKEGRWELVEYFSKVFKWFFFEYLNYLSNIFLTNKRR